MIEGIKQQSVYESCNRPYLTNETQTYPKAVTQFNIQEILQEIKNYTYKEEEQQPIEDETMEKLKKKLQVEEEDLYKLQQNGFNLEQLALEDYSGYSFEQTKTKSVSDVSYETEKIESKIETIKKKNDTMYLDALYNQKTITINSLYESNFKGSYKKTQSSCNSQEMASLLQMNGLMNSEQNEWAANLLVEYGMEVNTTSINRLKNIDAAIESLDKVEEAEKVREDLEAEKVPGERPLMEEQQVIYSRDQIQDIKKELGQVTETDIQALLEEGKAITINNLKEMMYKNTKTITQKSEAVQTEEIKNQINQIRAKLTAEAAQKISEKMPLESSQLSEVVQELNAVEEQVIEEALKIAEVEVTEENKAIMSDVMQTKEAILMNPVATLALEVESDEAIVLNELHRALTAYGENESVAEARFGESIKVVESQIEDVLRLQGIEVTEETLQAAKALIMNDMEITPDAMQNVLQIATKMNTFLEELTPNQAAVLIKEGLNPYHASIDTINEWLSEESFEALEMSIAEAIVALDEKGALSESQREGLIGFYRIMQAVNQNREEVIGYLYKNELPLTVAHLQEATKYIKAKNHIEVTIDDEFGEVVSRSEAETAQGLLKESSEKVAKTIDVVQIIEDMELPQEAASHLQKINAFLYPYIKQQFKQKVGEFEGMATLPQSFLDKLEAIKNVDSAVIENMMEEQIPLTISNIYWMNELEKNPSIYGELLEQKGLLKKDLPEHLEALEQELAELEKEAQEEKRIAVETGDLVSYKGYKQVEEVVQVQRQLMDQEGIYQIPFMIDGEQKLVQLYINKDGGKNREEESRLKAVISYETKTMGTVKAYIEMQEDELRYKVQGENMEVTERLKQNSDSLETLIEALGYGISGREYSLEETSHKTENSRLIKAKYDESLFEEVV